MPRDAQQDDQNNLFNPTSYGRFFQSSDRFDRDLVNLELARLRQAAISDLEDYQQQIKARQETREKIENLLKRNKLSPPNKIKAINMLASLKTELEYHQAKFKSIANSHPSLQAHFGLQT